jgi:hypothetical protein
MKRIPIKAAQRIADDYGYDQVIIYARKVGQGPGSGEHVTTYGVNKDHCNAAGLIGDHLKYKVFGWKEEKNDKNRV